MPAEEIRDSAPTLDERGRATPRTAGARESHESTPPEIGSGERYRRGDEIARGGMGRVVEANDALLGRTVAVKESLAVDAETAARFEREVQITARLEHPSIVPVYDAGRDASGVPYYVMRKVSGRPLDALIVASKGLDERLTLLPHLLAVLDAVGHAHRRGIVHRDLKPNNVLIGDLGETVVIDWGLAKVIGEDTVEPVGTMATGSRSGDATTVAGVVVGTPGFMSPEQAVAGAIDARSDVFALGATLYHLLGGAPPYHGSSATAILDRTVMEAPRPLRQLAAGVPPDLVTIVDKAMARDPDVRYSDAAAMGEDLRRFLAGQLVASHHYSRRQRVARFARKNKVAIAMVGVAAIIVIVVATLSLRRIVADRDRIAGAQARAEAALADARATAESLLVDKARAVVENDPSHALALLRDLPPDSTRWAIDAHSVATAARQRGVRFALPGHPGATNVLALSPDGNQLLSHGSDHVLLLHDLVARTSRRLAGPQRAPLWAVWAGSSIVVFDIADHEALRIVDPTTGRDSRIAARDVHQVTGSFTDWIAWQDHAKHVWVARVGDRAGTDLGADKSIAITGITLASDAGRLIVHGDVATQVFARTGDTWRHHATIATPSVTGKLAPDGKHCVLVTVDQITEWRLDDTPVTVNAWPGRWLTALYSSHRDMLFGIAIDSKLMPLGDEPRSVPSVSAMATPLADGLVASGDSDVLRILGNGFELRVPAGGHIGRTASRPGVRWLAGATQNLIFVWDVTETVPDRIDPHVIDFAVPSKSYLVVGSELGEFVEFVDWKSATPRYALTPPRRAFTSADTDTLAWATDDGVETLTHDGVLRTTPIAGARAAVPRPDGTLVVGTADGKIVEVAIGGGTATVLGDVGNPVRRVAANRGHFAMYTDEGSIWRSTDNRVVPGFDTIEDAWIAGDGTIYLSRSATIVRWSVGAADVVHVADLPQPAAMVRGLLGSKLVVATRDNAVYVVTPETARVEPLLGPGPPAALSRDGRIVARMSPSRIDIVDLVYRSEWSIPAIGGAYRRIFVMPDGSGVIATDDNAGTVMWDLGLSTIDDTADWVARRTNARAGARRDLTWDLPAIVEANLPASPP